MNILGVSAFNHDSAAALLSDDRLVFAAAEERYSHLKHDAAFPAQAIVRCLEEGKLTPDDIDLVAFYEHPEKVLARRLWTAAKWPSALNRLSVEHTDLAALFEERMGYTGKIVCCDHHVSHAAWALYCTGLEEAAVMIVDGVGEWATTTSGEARSDGFKLHEIGTFPDSIGLFYALITGYLGFYVNSGEYKVMGLAPYGEPTLKPQLEQVIGLDNSGRVKTDLSYFDLVSGRKMHSTAFEELIGFAPIEPGTAPTRAALNLAASAQSLLEDILLALAQNLQRNTGLSDLCLGGGVAMNCAALGRLSRSGIFTTVHVPAAPGDDGSAIGAAVAASPTGRRSQTAIKSIALGDQINPETVAEVLGPSHSPLPDTQAMIEAVADRLAAGEIIAFAQGRAEFGPRALGSRSILADPRSADMRERINTVIKQRESFRPFAPAVNEEDADDWFETIGPSHFMQRTVKVRDPEALQAVTHIDGSARLQTVARRSNPLFHALIKAFGLRTGCPVLLNTSLNVAGVPIAQTTADAFLAFGHSGCDALAIGNYVVEQESLNVAGNALAWVRRAEGGVAPGSSVYSIF